MTAHQDRLPYLTAAMAIGAIDPWIRRVDQLDDTTLVQCQQCWWSFVAITGYQAALNAAAHTCTEVSQTTLDVSG